ncbi:MAG: YdcF family protein [Acidimicrobiia bacterium]|nr:YdcF family protein [Acidimicrobiia bacterium]
MTLRRALRLAVRTGAALALLGVVYLVVTFVQVWLQAGHDGARPAQAIVVLGAAQYDGVPSPVLANRLDHVVELYEDGIAPLIVVTGGRQPGDRFTEAGAGATYLQQHGVPGSAIERETTGGTTWESLAAAARFLRDDGITDVVLVSDGYHNLRIGGIAHELGLEAEVSPASGRAPLGALMRETVAVAVGRLIGYDRLVRLDETVEQAGVLAPGAAR